MLLTLVLAAGLAGAQPRLDRPYKNLIHPETDARVFSVDRTPPRSNVHRVIRLQTSVKDQVDRGTCSIFSATALLEGMLTKTGRVNAPADLSEEWLQYLTTQRASEEGSTSPDNFQLLRRHGIPGEARLPYNGETWTSKRQGLAAKRCGHLPRGRRLKACLISHRDPALLNMSDADLLNPVFHLYDPEFVAARLEAAAHRMVFFRRDRGGDGIVRKTAAIREILLAGIPLALDLDFFDGAWNHPGAHRTVYRSDKLWEQGIVTHPEPGSADLRRSTANPDGHSVVVVGYDDTVELEYVMSMTDGSRRKFKRKGVYIFKNSWGADTWGKDFTYDGVSYPGYGMILQAHAHAHGQFYKLDLD